MTYDKQQRLIERPKIGFSGFYRWVVCRPTDNGIEILDSSKRRGKKWFTSNANFAQNKAREMGSEWAVGLVDFDYMGRPCHFKGFISYQPPRAS